MRREGCYFFAPLGVETAVVVALWQVNCLEMHDIPQGLDFSGLQCRTVSACAVNGVARARSN
jgi:hypothetical protein